MRKNRNTVRSYRFLHVPIACVICCSCAQSPPPPYGEALVIVDTDLPVPAVVSRLRIDVYGADGTWLASREDPRISPEDFPTSFSVYNDHAEDRVVYVRLRAYPDERRIRYTGTIYGSLPDLLLEMPRSDGKPRLIQDGVDKTPEFEPDPTVTVDRVVRIRLSEGQRGQVRVKLSGDCVGVMPSLRSWSSVSTCINADSRSAPVVDFAQSAWDEPIAGSLAGSYNSRACDSQAASQTDRVCVPGGVFIFGDAFYRPSHVETGENIVYSKPERVISVSRFFLDRDEVSVERFRRSLGKGFMPPVPVGVREIDGPPMDGCTYSALARDRESYPLACVPWPTARAFCQSEGGDLPTEAQWEWTATAAGRGNKANYTWGDDAPACDKAIYGRHPPPRFSNCPQLPEGVQPLYTVSPPQPTADVNTLGIRNLVGSLSEHMLDTFMPFSHICWRLSSSVDPVCGLTRLESCPDLDSSACWEDPAALHSLRGASWISLATDLRLVARQDRTHDQRTPGNWVGFRCAYPAP